MRTSLAILIGTLVLTSVTVVHPSGAYAQEDGAMVALHALRREGSSICMIDHFHHGYSAGHRSKKLAMREAVSGWRGFTAFEYGDHWASWRRAKTKRVSCDRSSGGWSCSIEARPCKPHRRSRARRKRR